MAVKKSDLYVHLWESCDELRGGMDASQYKDYVLVLLFLKYVSDRAGAPDSLIEVPEDASFDAVAKLKNNKDIGEEINKVLARLAAENDLRGVIDVADFNDDAKLGKGQDMVDRLTKLVAVFENPELDFTGNRADGDDLLGDAYEFLMRHFATESGKSKGQFYTPAEVSRVLASVIGVENATTSAQTIHDPACGSGSLLLKAVDRAKETAGVELTPYGQEMDNSTAALARMNMFIHGAGTAEIWNDNTLSRPHFVTGQGDRVKLKLHDFIVANPPFSAKAWSTGVNTKKDQFERFKFGTPPAKNGDYAFLLHILTALKSTGTAGVILPHGVLFRGNAEADIRRRLVEHGYIKTIIGLPANLFYGTGIPACIIVLDKASAATRDGILMVDASRGYAKDGPKNRLRERDIHRIVDAVTARAETAGFSRVVPTAEIADPRNDFNLNIARYITDTTDRDSHDLDAHLRGGIPQHDIDALASYWGTFPTLRDAVVVDGERAGYANLGVDATELDAVISSASEVGALRHRCESVFANWWQTIEAELLSIDSNTKPKALIESMSESLLAASSTVPLIDPYAAYQAVREFWAGTMADDVYLIADVGWAHAAQPYKLREKSKRPVDFKVGKDKFSSEILPAALLVSRFLEAEATAAAEAQLRLDALDAEIEALREEHTGDEGLLVDAINDKGQFTAATIDARIAALRDAHAGQAAPDEMAAAVEARQRLADLAAEVAEFTRDNAPALSGVVTKTGTLNRSKVKAVLAGDGTAPATKQMLGTALGLLDSVASAKKTLVAAERAVDQALDSVPDPDDDFNEERALIGQVAGLLEHRGALDADAKAAAATLNDAISDMYGGLGDPTVRDIVVNDRWKPALHAALVDQVEAAVFLLSSRLRELAQRYATPLPELLERSAELDARVEKHLHDMGYHW